MPKVDILTLSPILKPLTANLVQGWGQRNTKVGLRNKQSGWYGEKHDGEGKRNAYF